MPSKKDKDKIKVSHLLEEPILGPIVGHVTDTEARVWIRGDNPSGGRTVGVAAVFDGEKCRSGTATYFRLHREFYRTGVAYIRKLKPDSEATVRVGVLRFPRGPDDQRTVETDDVLETLPKVEQFVDSLMALNRERCEVRFRTFPPANGKTSFSFLFGSCRYPGIAWSAKRADQIFGPMLRHVDDPKNPARFVLMIGDQIYADMMNRHIPLGRADTEEEFLDRYMDAFSTYNMRRLLARVPVYMTLDDHEIEDNWNAARLHSKAGRQLFVTAVQTYRSFQWLHSPRNFGDQLYYTFEYGGAPFFVTDGRTQRYKSDRDRTDDDCRDNHLLGFPVAHRAGPRVRAQVDELCAWLVRMQKKVGSAPKFVVSAGVFAPNDVRDRKYPGKSDSWAAFPNTRRLVLATIVEKSVENVVFLCGDVHCSILAEINFYRNVAGERGDPLPLKAYSITSSAFYWPYLFADGEPGSFVHDSEDERTPDPFYFGGLDKKTMSGAQEEEREERYPYLMHYRAWNFEQKDNFAKVTVTPSAISIELFDREGKPIRKTGPSSLSL